MEYPCNSCPDYLKCKQFDSKSGCPEYKEYQSELRKQKGNNKNDKKAC